MTSATDFVLDLDAAKRERANPEIIVRFGGNDLTIPGELPADVFDPFLSPDFDLVKIVAAFMEAIDDTDESASDWIDALIDVLESNPDLGSQVLTALKSAYTLLLGAENYALFVAAKPSLPDYFALTKGLLGKYGVSLGEAFASPVSSETDGATPKPTSPVSTPDSTPATAGAAPEPAPVS